jgi:hypothetical protein
MVIEIATSANNEKQRLLLYMYEDHRIVSTICPIAVKLVAGK